MNRSLYVLIVTAVMAAFVVYPTPVSADTGSTPEISNYEDIAPRGQLIIPVGQQFVVPQAWDTLRLTVWRGLGDSTIDPVIVFAASIGNDRSARYGGTDYVTAIWTGHPIPGWTSRKACDESFGGDQAVLTVGESIGDAGCYTMLEYDITALLPRCPNCGAREPVTRYEAVEIPSAVSTDNGANVVVYDAPWWKWPLVIAAILLFAVLLGVVYNALLNRRLTKRAKSVQYPEESTQPEPVVVPVEPKPYTEKTAALVAAVVPKEEPKPVVVKKPEPKPAVTATPVVVKPKPVVVKPESKSTVTVKHVVVKKPATKVAPKNATKKPTS